MPIAMMDKATPTSRARKPFFFSGKESERSEFFSEKEEDARHGSKPEGDVECYYYRYSREWDFFFLAKCSYGICNLDDSG